MALRKSKAISGLTQFVLTSNLLTSNFVDQNFSDAHKIGNLGARDLKFFF